MDKSDVEIRRIAEILILSAVAIATTVLIGWAFQIDALKRIVSGLTSMNPLTAVCFEAICVTMLLTRRGPPTGRMASGLVMALPLCVLAVGALKLIDIASGTTWCPDAVLFPSQLDAGQAYPSRIAPNVALSFVLLSIALLVSDRPRLSAYVNPQLLITPVLCAALTAIIGYTYDTSGFYKVRQFIPMALTSAVNFIVVSVALVFSRPQQGFLRVLPPGSPGAKSYAWMLPACVLVPTILGSACLIATDHGWLGGRGTANSVVTILTVLTMSIFAFLHSGALNRSDLARRTSELQQRRLVMELDLGNRALQMEILERKRMEELARHQATHDALTGLPNRLLFVDRLERSIGRTIRQDTACALFYVDVNDFKPINDRYGHQAGDELLRLLAGRLKTTMRAVDTVARLGGDEFAVIMDAPTNTDHAVALAERLSQAAGKPYQLNGAGGSETVNITVGISIGIALFPIHATDVDNLVRIADAAMYRAKSDGKRRELGSPSIRMAVATLPREGFAA